MSDTKPAPKYSYSYAVVRVDDGLNRTVAIDFDNKTDANRYREMCERHNPSREFRVRQRRHRKTQL